MSFLRSYKCSFCVQLSLKRRRGRFLLCTCLWGLIEWHGGHLPLGTDCLKAHALLVKCAEKYGGLVYPPVYFPSSIYAEGEFQGADKTHKVPLFTDLFQSLKAAGFRVIVVVSGHNTLEQLQMINYALAPVTDDDDGYWGGTLGGVAKRLGRRGYGPRGEVGNVGYHVFLSCFG